MAPETAAADACHAEHTISPDTVRRLTRLIEFIQKCPRTGDEWLEHFHCYCQKERPSPAAECSEACIDRCLERIRAARGTTHSTR
jgi:DtxR family Mn-dependent transcriptional regulator